MACGACGIEVEMSFNAQTLHATECLVVKAAMLKGNRWIGRAPFSTGRAIVNTMTCLDCGGQVWDSQKEMELHREQCPGRVSPDVVREQVRWADGYHPDSFEATFAAIFQEAFDLLVERQRKYGPKNIARLGLFGVLDRMSADKLERVRRAFNGRLVAGVLELDAFEDFDDESFEDALKDISNYSLIMLALKRRQWGRPLQEDM